MPITEFVTFKFKETFTIDHPPIRQRFQTLLVEQAEWSGYPLTLYINPQNERLIYLVSGWEGVEAHHKWIASKDSHDLLTFITVEDFAHVAVDFGQFPTDAEMLICRKSSADDQHHGFGTEEDHIKSQGEIWAAEGRGVEKPTDIYRFAALEALPGNLDDSGLITMKRIHFDDAEV